MDESFIYEVLSVVEEIPVGKVATYGLIAHLLGRDKNSRLVGKILSDSIHYGKYPCHRVVNHAGKMAPCFWNQRMLLEQEGVQFRTNGTVDMKKHLWTGDIAPSMQKADEPEIWDLYNEKRELLHRDHIRGEEIPEGTYHLVVHVWIRNLRGEYLISQRAASRPTYPLMWECVGGSVLKGEDSIHGAIRETKEEVGIDLSPEDGKLLFSTTRKINGLKKYNDILDVWLFEYRGEVNLDDATTDEVAQVFWMDEEKIQDMFDTHQFVDTLDYFFTKVK